MLLVQTYASLSVLFSSNICYVSLNRESVERHGFNIYDMAISEYMYQKLGLFMQH